MRARCTTTRMLAFRSALLILAAAVVAPAVGAQTVSGRLVEQAGAPIATALVTLIDAQGRSIRSGISGARGEFALTTDRAGRYTLRIDRIGFAAHETAPFELAATGISDMVIVVAAAPVQLAAIRAQGSSRCVVRPRDGSVLARLWDEASKGLQFTAILERDERLLLEGVSYRRELDRRAREQLQVLQRLDFVARNLPFRAAPIETLASAGFALVDSDGSHVYFGPTAATLLSPAFLERHCFHRIVESRADPARIGLGFQPIRGESTAGIAGTFWLDRHDASVLAIEYEYRDPTGRLPRGGSGLVEFGRLANGLPHVARWWIRMPQVQLTPTGDGGATLERLAVIEAGGVVVRIDGSELGDPHGVVAALDAAMHDGLIGPIVDDAELQAIAAQGGTLRDALYRFDGLVRVGEGAFVTHEDGRPERMLCVESGAAAAMPYSLRRHGAGVPICAMMDVYLAGERVERPGRFLLTASVADFSRIEVLPAARAAAQLGADGSGDVLLLTPRSRD